MNLALLAQGTAQAHGGGAAAGQIELLGLLFVFALAVFLGVELISKVPQTLHTPLMSGANAISGITIVGALVATGHGGATFATLLGLAALILATVNCVGGFMVTDRMLKMFKSKR
jgi:NAD(P) transhydrogenase subunit alpha